MDIYGRIYPDNKKYTQVKYILVYDGAYVSGTYYIRVDYKYQGSWTYQPISTTAGENTVILNPDWDEVYLVFYGRSTKTYGRITIQDIVMS